MSHNLAPFVAAVLRDREVADLVEENKRLREENRLLRVGSEVWTVRIESADGEKVYATGKLDLRTMTIGLRDEERASYFIAVEMEPVQGVEPCRISTFLQGKVVLTTMDRYEALTIGPPLGDIGNGIIAIENRFEIGWQFYYREEERNRPIQGIYLHAEIPNERLDLVTEELANGLGPANALEAIPVAWEVTNDGPIVFERVYLSPSGLAAELEQLDE